MGYRKAKIPIRLHKVELPCYEDGYKFDACFSNGKLFEMGVYKNSKGQWIISDLNTGLAVCWGKSRTDAVKRFQSDYLSRFERMIYDNSKKYAPNCNCHENWYEHQTEEFQTLLEKLPAEAGAK